MQKKGGWFRFEHSRYLGNREGFLRLPYFVLTGVVFLILIVSLYEYFDFQQDEQALRNSLVTFESQQTLQTLQMIHFYALEENWQAIYKVFVEQEQLLPNSRALLVDPAGNIIISRKADTLLSSPDTWLFNAVEPLAPQSHWSTDGNTLTTGIPLLGRDGEVKIYLLRETNLSEQIKEFSTLRFRRLLLFLSGVVVIVIITLVMIRWLFLLPLSKIYELSRAIVRGDPNVRAPSSSIQELEKINRAFNEMINHLANQQSALEEMNRRLEDTVVERTRELEVSNTAVRKQAQQLEEINALFTSTAGVLDVKTLANTALEKAISTAKGENGAIWLLGYFASQGLSENQKDLLEQVRVLGDKFHVAETRNIVSDWSCLEADHPLKHVAPQLTQMQIQALVSFPLTIAGEQIGTLCIGNREPREWASDELVLLETIAHHLGTAAERIRHIENIRQNNALMRRLMVQSELLNRTLTQTEVIATIGQGTVELCEPTRLSIFLVKDEGDVSCAWAQNMTPGLIDSVRCLLNPITTPLQVEDTSILEASSELRLLGEKWGFRALHVWPLMFEGQVIAFVCCFYEMPRICVRNQQEVFETFFRQGAASLESARLYQAETTQRRLSEALGDIAATLNSTLDLEAVLQGILSNLGRVVQHDTAAIMLLENGRLQMMHSTGQTERNQWSKDEWKFHLHEIPSLQRIYETGQALIIPNTDLDPNWIRFDRSSWIKSYAGAPIFRRGEIVGFINVNSSIPGFYSPKVCIILQAFANQAAIALENARLYQNVHDRMNEANALYRAIRPLINTAEDVKTLVQQICASVTQEFSSTHCSFFRVDHYQQTLVLEAQSGDQLVDMPDLSLDGSGLTVAAARTGQSIYSPDVALSPNYVTGVTQTRSELAIPLFSGNQVFGVLNLESSRVDAFDERARRLLTAFCEQAALGLENARLFATIRKQAAQRKQINDITQTALKVTSSGGMLQQLAEQVAALLNSDGCYITWWEPNGNRTIPMAAYGPNQEIYTSIPVVPNEINLTHSSLTLGKTLVIPNVHHSPYIPSEVAADFPIQSALVLPMIADGQKIGAVLIGYVGHHDFTIEEISLGEQAAGQIALAIARLRSVDLAQRRAQEADNLRMATASLGSSLELHQVLDDILTYLEQVIRHDSACMFLLEEDQYRVWAVKNITGGDVQNRQFPRSDPLLHSVEVERRPITLVNAQEDPRLHGWGWTENVARWMGIPLTAGSEFLGILTLQRHERSDFTQEEISLALAFAGQAAIAVQNARLYQNTQQRALELEALHTATTSLVSTLDLQKLLECIVSASASAIPATQTAALHMLTDTRQLELRVQLGDFEMQCGMEAWNDPRGPWAYVLNERSPLLVSAASKLPEQVSPISNNPCSLMVAPLIQEGRVLGLLTLGSQAENAFSEPDLRLLISFASTATAAIHNAQLHRAVQYLAITDPLTGLYNRRGFYDLAGHVVKQSQFFNRALSAIMMDIDYFKKINDQYGHDAGDAVLQTLAMRFRKVLREADLICRFGGEEFAILLPESDITGARTAAYRLHHIITESPVDSAAGPINVTVSIGVAEFSPEDQTLDDLLKDADKALYTAKAKGRNQVSVWNE